MSMQRGSPRADSAALSARALSFSVEARRLLDRVDLRAEQSEFVGLIGPNGAGKSTLLRALSSVLSADSGAVSLYGEDLRAMPARRVAELLALVPQIAPYTQGFTTFELVLMGRYPHLGRMQVEGRSDDRIARESMQLTETEQFAGRTIETLSGGERQRVFLARAVAQQPQVLLLDEPTANLDILHQLKILGLVRRLVDDGLTSITAIHDLNLAARFCDRLVLLSDGRVAAEGTPASVLTAKTIEAVFGVRAAVYREPGTGALTVSPIAPADDQSSPLSVGVGDGAVAVSASNGVSAQRNPGRSGAHRSHAGGEAAAGAID